MSDQANAEAPNYIIMTHIYDPNNGGCVVMHQLVHELNQMGHKAFVWPAPQFERSLRQHIHHLRRNPKSYFKRESFYTHPDLDTPIATAADLKPNSIVLYAEIVPGNPLKAKNVVRWLLYKPGLAHPYRFTDNEMYFRVNELSDMPELTGGAPDLFVWSINPAYKNEGRTDRKGACYMLRKGKDKPRIPETADAELLDGMSHEEIAEVFNRCDVFYSYDEATFYSVYAVLCGCRSVVVPGLYKSQEEWAKNMELGKYGIAYGVENIPHADATREQLFELLRTQETDGLETIKNFVALTQEKFANT